MRNSLSPNPAASRRPGTGISLPAILLPLLPALLAAVPPAAAQTPPADPIALDSIVVQVLRSPVQLNRLPFAASVLAGAALREANSGLFLEEALHGLPGVRVQNRYNPAVGERISIRGFGARAQFGVRGIKVLVDGIPATLPDGQTTLDHLDIGSLGRVEALRGPAAAIYGNGAGGVLLFESAPSLPGAYNQDLTAVAGSDGLLRVQTTVSGRAGGIAYRASVAGHRFDGFRDNPTDSGADPYSRAERNTLSAGFSADLAGGRLAIRLSGLDLDALNAGSLPAALFDEGSNQAWGFNVRRGTQKQVRQGQAGVSWRGPVGGGLAAEFSSYGVWRELDNPIPNTVIDLDRRGGGVRAALVREWQMTNGPARMDFGLEGELQSDNRKNFENLNGEPGALALSQQEDVRAGALFGQLRLPLARRLDAVAALRLDRFRFEASDRFVAADNPDDSGTRTMGGLSPSLGFHLDLGSASLYGSAARSFETPTTTELANRPDRAGGFNPELEPQTGWTLESGLRGTLRGRAAWDLTAFASRLQGQLVAFEVPAAPGRSFFRNAGKSRIQGIEGSVRAALTAALTGRLSYGYIDARFTEFAVDGEDFADNRIPGTAPHRLEAALRAAAGPWFGEIRSEMRGAVPVNDANDAEAAGFTLLDLRLGGSGLRVGSTRLSLFAGITNLTNVRHASSVVVNAFGGRYFEPGPDRGGYAGVSIAWGAGDR